MQIHNVCLRWPAAHGLTFPSLCILAGAAGAAVGQPVELSVQPIATATTEKTAMGSSAKIAGLADGGTIVVGVGAAGNPINDSTGPSTDFFVTQLDSTGSAVGFWRYAEDYAAYERASACDTRVVGESEIVVVAGHSFLGFPCDYEETGVVLFSLNSNGSVAWARRVEGSAERISGARKPMADLDVCIGDDGSIFVASTLLLLGEDPCEPDACSPQVGTVSKFSSAGVHQWTKRISSSPNTPLLSKFNIADIEPFDGGVMGLAQVELVTPSESPCGSSEGNSVAVLFALSSSGALTVETVVDAAFGPTDVASSLSLADDESTVAIAINNLDLTQSLADNSTTTAVISLGSPLTVVSSSTAKGLAVEYACFARGSEDSLWAAGAAMLPTVSGDLAQACLFEFDASANLSRAVVYRYEAPSSDRFQGLDWADDQLWSTGPSPASLVVLTDSSLIGSCTSQPVGWTTTEDGVSLSASSLGVSNGIGPSTITLYSFAVNSELIDLCETSNGCPPCAADFDRDGDVDSDDIVAFLEAWDESSPCADADFDSDVDSDDITAFFLLWDNGGC